MARSVRLIAPAGALALALLAPAAAHAGSYDVFTCAAGGGSYGNNAWVAKTVAGVSADGTCAGGTIGLTAAAGASVANNTSATLTFSAPAGTSIAGFSFSNQLDYVDAAVNTTTATTHQLFALYSLGATVFAGAGDYDTPTRTALNAQKTWYGYPLGTAHLARATRTAADFPALASSGGQTQLILRLGCFNRGSACTIAAGGGVNTRLYGSQVTISDPTPPSVAVEASGLLSGGQRDGSDPVTLTASDSAGIRSVQLLDVTNPAAPVVVGGEDYTTQPTDTADGGAQCDFSKPAPCPSLKSETLRPTALAAGQRSVVVRVTDTGGNVVDSGPYPVDAVTPSNRGALNGLNATETSTLQAAFPHVKAPRRTVDYGTKVPIAGVLRNAAGEPVAGAHVEVLTRDLRRGATSIVRKTLITGSDGSFAMKATASASRLIQFGWRAHVNDDRYASSAYVTLNARAAAKLKVSTRAPRLGRRLTISGRMAGVEREGVTILVQGRAKGAKGWETFADTSASRSGAFKVHYRFRASASRGHRFEFRARIRPGATAPYETGYSKTIAVRVR